MKDNFGGFTAKGNWYRGNLHCHTNRSDAKESPEETVEFYKKAGHDFIAITDHTKKIGEGAIPPNPAASLSSDSFLVLPGAEYDWWGKCGIVHIVAVGPGYDIQPPTADTVDFSKALKTWWEAGGFAWWAHPYWSHNGTEDLERQEYLPAFEVYNNVCEVEVGKGLSVVHWDRVLGNNRNMLGLATDDTHSLARHGAGGWVCVKAEALTAEAIIGALRRGDFYASSGPVFEDVRFTSNEEKTSVHIKCSPARTIKFISVNGRGSVHRAPAGETFTDVTLPWNWNSIFGPSLYVRIEITDSEGRSAWTQPAWNPAGK